MRRAALSCLLLFALRVSPALADDAPQRDLPLGTIDVAYIFKNYKPVQEKLVPLKAAVGELEKTVQLRQVEIEQIGRRLQSPKEGDDRAKLQAQFAKLQTELRVYIEKERQDLQKRELQIQADVYKDIQAEVKRLAKERGLKLVIVRPRGSLETQDVSELNRTLNQLVIFEDGLDLTDDVLQALESREPEEKKDEPEAKKEE